MTDTVRDDLVPLRPLAEIEGLDALLEPPRRGRDDPWRLAAPPDEARPSQEAIRLTAELNGRYHSPEEVRGLMSAITRRRLPGSLTVFPPFTTDCGRNTRFGERVFLNSVCRFQDQGGIEIGDDVLIGHNAVITTPVVITATITWPFDSPAGTSPSVDNPAQTGKVDLSNFALTVTQVTPNPLP